MVLRQSDHFTDEYPSVAARATFGAAPRSAEIDAEYVVAQSNTNGCLRKIMPCGTFAGSIPDSSKVRPLPRTRLVDPLMAATTTTVAVDRFTARFFKATAPADALAVLCPYAVITIGGTIAQNDTFTATIAGQSATSAPANATPTPTESAAALATALNRHPSLRFLVVAIAAGALVYVHARDMVTPYTIAVSKASTGGTIAISGSVTTLQSNVAIGTVSAVDVAANTITLAAAAAISLPIGFPIGVAGSSPEDLGLMRPTQPKDLLYDDNNIVGLYDEYDVWQARLPYVDGQLKALYPQLNFL
jgi:hypothetical protein